MKMIKVLDAKATTLVSDALNQRILKELVMAPHSVSDLSRKLNVPVLKIWRRIQHLTEAKLIEVAGSRKIGNLEQKLYRATATQFVPQQLFQVKPSAYSKIQGEMLKIFSSFDDIPKEGDPTDLVLYAQMLSFAEVFEKPGVQESIVEIKEHLANFRQRGIKN